MTNNNNNNNNKAGDTRAWVSGLLTMPDGSLRPVRRSTRLINLLPKIPTLEGKNFKVARRMDREDSDEELSSSSTTSDEWDDDDDAISVESWNDPMVVEELVAATELVHDAMEVDIDAMEIDDDYFIDTDYSPLSSIISSLQALNLKSAGFWIVEDGSSTPVRRSARLINSGATSMISGPVLAALMAAISCPTPMVLC
jgi:hypothetical protein